jgi:hypothetical protein
MSVLWLLAESVTRIRDGGWRGGLVTGRRFSGYQDLRPGSTGWEFGSLFWEMPKLLAWPSLRGRLSGAEVRRLFSADGEKSKAAWRVRQVCFGYFVRV